MQFRDVIARRRMVRNYLPDPIEMASVGRIVDAALRAPSAGYSQGLGIVIVTDADRRREIAALGEEGEYVAAGFDPWISRAPVHIVLSVSEEAYHQRYREADKLGPDGEEIEWPVPYWWVDAGAALMGMLLAAVDEGLSAGFLGVHSFPGLATLLGLPPDQSPIGVVTVGKAAPDRRSGSLARGPRPRDAVVHLETWAG